jgi:hypothetical protein
MRCSSWQHSGVGVKKTRYIKIKDRNPSIKSTRQIESMSRHNLKERKKKPTIKERKSNANMTQGYEMIINDNKEDLR